MIRYHRFDTAMGPMYATAEEAGITGVYFEGGRHAPAIAPHWVLADDDPALRDCERQLHEYFAGRRTTFHLPLAPRGTAFQQAVWKAIAAIGYGETVSYASIARGLGAANASRAVGAATGRNPISLIVPCHRVTGSGGALTGYAGGLDRKRRLLALEGAPAHAA